jgi:membrane-bound ClpP family serine protease
MPDGSGFRQRLVSLLSDPVVAIILALAVVSLVSRIWLLIGFRFR